PALRPAAPPPTTTTSYRSFSMTRTLPDAGPRRHFRCCFRERSVALACGARVGYPGRSCPGRPAPEAPAHPAWHHLDQRRGADRHLEEHALAPRERPAEAEPRTAATARRRVPGAARRAGRCARGRRPPRPVQAAYPQRPPCLPAHAADNRACCLEGRDPARARAQPTHPRRLRVALRALRANAAGPRRAGHHDGPGEVAEFDTRMPHWFGPAGGEPVEILSVHSTHGKRMHVRAAPRGAHSTH